MSKYKLENFTRPIRKRQGLQQIFLIPGQNKRKTPELLWHTKYIHTCPPTIYSPAWSFKNHREPQLSNGYTVYTLKLTLLPTDHWASPDLAPAHLPSLIYHSLLAPAIMASISLKKKKNLIPTSRPLLLPRPAFLDCSSHRDLLHGWPFPMSVGVGRFSFSLTHPGLMQPSPYLVTLYHIFLSSKHLSLSEIVLFTYSLVICLRPYKLEVPWDRYLVCSVHYYRRTLGTQYTLNKYLSN